MDLKKPDVDTLVDDIALCSCNDSIVKKLMVFRSNRIAHRNAKALLSTEEIGERFGLTYEDIRTLLERAKVIVNRYSYLFAALTYSTKVIGHNDFEYIFKCVEEKVEEAHRQRSRMDWEPCSRG